MNVKLVLCPLSALAAALLLLAGCGERSTRLDDPTPHAMGQEVRAGTISYIVTSTEWRSALVDETEHLVPRNRYLVITLTIRNNGPSEANLPLLTLVNAKGESFLEVGEVRGLTRWIGALRTLAPSEEITGRVVFDVPTGPYRLRVSDGGDQESERTALIEIPMTVDAPLAAPEQPRTPPQN